MTKHDIVKKAAKEGIEEAISFLITNYVEAVYFFVLIRIGDNFSFTRNCLEKIFEKFFLSLATLHEKSNIENTLLNISEYVCAQTLLHLKTAGGYSISNQVLPEDIKHLHILRNLPFNYHWPLVKFLTKTKDIVESPAEKTLLDRAIEMHIKAILENFSSIIECQNSLERMALKQEEIANFIKKYTTQKGIFQGKRIFSFFLAFSAFSLLLLFTCYLTFLYHFPDQENEARVLFFSSIIAILLCLCILKIFIYFKIIYIKKIWKKHKDFFT